MTAPHGMLGDDRGQLQPIAMARWGPDCRGSASTGRPPSPGLAVGEGEWGPSSRRVSARRGSRWVAGRLPSATPGELPGRGTTAKGDAGTSNARAISRPCDRTASAFVRVELIGTYDTTEERLAQSATRARSVLLRRPSYDTVDYFAYTRAACSYTAPSAACRGEKLVDHDQPARA
jgi:hypothetical protein